ncbi:phosphatidate cytidylyltransferase [Populus alba x Populus x berolinensis]|nr:phosphatidate cytidylyltransferase [Populus alba x Populus x berolinensis]
MELLRGRETSAGMTSKIKWVRTPASYFVLKTPPVSGTDRPITCLDHIKTHLMSSSKFSDSNGAVINENTSLNAALIKNVRKRKAGMKKHIAKHKNANTSLVKENVYLKNRQAWMTKSQKRQKKTLVYLKDKYNELTDKATGLSNLLMESYAQLQERNMELEASNAQLRERNAVLENESNARDEVDIFKVLLHRQFGSLIVNARIIMEIDKIAELKSFLKVLPPVGFCCVYGSSLHPNNNDKSSMVDYIIGVSDPKQWHSENMELNEDHYASWMVPLGGAKLITQVADKIGVGVHFNPFVTWNDKMLKYGVVRMHDLVQDVLHWERFYLCGRLQKPVHILVDNLDIGDVNSVNLRAAVSAALLLLPSKFTEEDLYSKICSLSYMGDLRMLFAEDKNKVKRIVEGQFGLFQSMYKPFLKEYEAKELLTFSLPNSHQATISQDCSLSMTHSLVHSLPPLVRRKMGMKLGEMQVLKDSGRVLHEVVIGSREEAARSMQRIIRRTVMVSSARQAVSGFLAAGGINATRYLANKVRKAWKSWT